MHLSKRTDKKCSEWCKFIHRDYVNSKVSGGSSENFHKCFFLLMYKIQYNAKNEYFFV